MDRYDRKTASRRARCVEELPFRQAVLCNVHSLEYCVVLRLRAAGKVMHYSIFHWSLPFMFMEPPAAPAPVEA
jgi:hypothetical protein